MNPIITEIVGIIASLFIIIAFTTKGEKKIRIIDSMGALIFIIYGFLIHSISVSLLNSVALLVNIYHVIKMCKEEKRSLADNKNEL